LKYLLKLSITQEDTCLCKRELSIDTCPDLSEFRSKSIKDIKEYVKELIDASDNFNGLPQLFTTYSKAPTPEDKQLVVRNRGIASLLISNHWLYPQGFHKGNFTHNTRGKRRLKEYGCMLYMTGEQFHLCSIFDVTTWSSKYSLYVNQDLLMHLLAKYDVNVTMEGTEDQYYSSKYYNHKYLIHNTPSFNCKGTRSIKEFGGFFSFFSITINGMHCKNKKEVLFNLKSQTSQIRKDLYMYEHEKVLYVLPMHPGIMVDTVRDNVRFIESNVNEVRNWLLNYGNCAYAKIKEEKYDTAGAVAKHMEKHLCDQNVMLNDHIFDMVGVAPNKIINRDIEGDCWRIMFEDSSFSENKILHHADVLSALKMGKDVRFKKDIFVWLIFNRRYKNLHIELGKPGEGFVGNAGDLGVLLLPYDALIASNTLSMGIGSTFLVDGIKSAADYFMSFFASQNMTVTSVGTIKNIDYNFNEKLEVFRKLRVKFNNTEVLHEKRKAIAEMILLRNNETFLLKSMRRVKDVEMELLVKIETIVKIYEGVILECDFLVASLINRQDEIRNKTDKLEVDEKMNLKIVEIDKPKPKVEDKKKIKEELKKEEVFNSSSVDKELLKNELGISDDKVNKSEKVIPVIVKNNNMDIKQSGRVLNADNVDLEKFDLVMLSKEKAEEIVENEMVESFTSASYLDWGKSIATNIAKATVKSTYDYYYNKFYNKILNRLAIIGGSLINLGLHMIDLCLNVLNYTIGSEGIQLKCKKLDEDGELVDTRIPIKDISKDLYEIVNEKQDFDNLNEGYQGGCWRKLFNNDKLISDKDFINSTMFCDNIDNVKADTLFTIEILPANRACHVYEYGKEGRFDDESILINMLGRNMFTLFKNLRLYIGSKEMCKIPIVEKEKIDEVKLPDDDEIMIFDQTNSFKSRVFKRGDVYEQSKWAHRSILARIMHLLLRPFVFLMNKTKYGKRINRHVNRLFGHKFYLCSHKNKHRNHILTTTGDIEFMLELHEIDREIVVENIQGFCWKKLIDGQTSEFDGCKVINGTQLFMLYFNSKYGLSTHRKCCIKFNRNSRLIHLVSEAEGAKDSQCYFITLEDLIILMLEGNFVLGGYFEKAVDYGKSLLGLVSKNRVVSVKTSLFSLFVSKLTSLSKITLPIVGTLLSIKYLIDYGSLTFDWLADKTGKIRDYLSSHEKRLKNKLYSNTADILTADSTSVDKKTYKGYIINGGKMIGSHLNTVLIKKTAGEKQIKNIDRRINPDGYCWKYLFKSSVELKGGRTMNYDELKKMLSYQVTEFDYKKNIKVFFHANSDLTHVYADDEDVDGSREGLLININVGDFLTIVRKLDLRVGSLRVTKVIKLSNERASYLNF